jgi:RNA polymerase sigma-70 factor (ECF subfamily)
MDDEQLAQELEGHRSHLRAVAFRMLGSSDAADDAVQEAWVRLSRQDADGIENLGGWLTTVVSRICLDQLRSRKARPQDPIEHAEGDEDDTVTGDLLVPTPEEEAVLGDSVGLALQVVLDTLTPPERVAFVLHDLFAMPFDDVAMIVGRSPDATRQLASRARRRVQGANADGTTDLVRKRAVVEAFLAASRGGDLDALVALLDPRIVARADAATVAMGADAEVVGAEGVAATFGGRAKGAEVALVDGRPGLVWAMGGQPKVVFDFVVEDAVVTSIELISDADTIAGMALEYEG